MPGIPANHIAVRHNGFIVGVGGRAVGGKPRRAVGSGGQGAYLVGDGIAVVAVVAAGKSNDIPRLQGAGVHMAHKNQIARAEIRCRHRIGQDNERLVAEPLFIRAVQKQGGYQSKQQNADG